MIDMKKQYRTRDGRRARILATDINSATPVIAAISTICGEAEVVFGFGLDGRVSTGEVQSPRDLVEHHPAQDLKTDQAIWVRGSTTQTWKPRHFAKFECGVVYCWPDGSTSHTADGTQQLTPASWVYWSATRPLGTAL
jgi:hypothetical protein